MLQRFRSALIVGPLLAIAPCAALAQDPIDEFKFGVLAHDVGLFDHHLETGADVNFELLFTPPEALSVIGSPRPQVGGSLNTASGEEAEAGMPSKEDVLSPDGEQETPAGEPRELPRPLRGRPRAYRGLQELAGSAQASR